MNYELIETHMKRIALLVAALRSGKYIQGQAYLEREDEGVAKNSLMGVCCRVAQQNGLKVVVEIYENVTWGKVTTFDGEQDYLPSKVQEWYGFGDDDPRLNYEGVAVTLSALNDDYDLTLNEIADLMEDQLFPKGYND